MSLNDEERAAIVSYEQEKAQRIFSQIDALKSLGYWDNIANRLYYAVFHAVMALLIHDGHNVNTHKGVTTLFGQYFIKTGIFTIEDGKLFAQLQSMRSKSDYNCAFDATEDEVEPMIIPAKTLLERISEYINKNKF